MKDELRKIVKEKRNRLQKIDVLTKSSQIKKRVFDLKEFKQAKTVLFYVSYDNEVYTHDMIKESMLMGKRVVVPKSDTNNNTLLLSKLTKWDDLELGAYTILEPKKEVFKEISINSIDFAIVPGVVFDEKGHRIGHGKGYYDRLLKNVSCTSIGLSFELQLVNTISAEKHDIKVDKIVTEKRIIDCLR